MVCNRKPLPPDILVQKRSPKKDTFADLWEISVAGHVRSGEDNIKAALRELKEELGIKTKSEDLEYLFTIRRSDHGEKFHIETLDDVFIYRHDLDVTNTKLQIKELTDIKFVYYEYLEQIYKNKDPKYVPANEEQTKLFKYLKKEFKKEPIFTIDIKLKEKEYLKLNRFFLLHDKDSLKIFFTVIIVMILVYFIGGNYTAFAQYLSIIYLIIFFCSIIILSKRNTKTIYQILKDTNNLEDKLIFYESHLEIADENMNMKVPFKDIFHVYETKTNFYIFTDRRKSYILIKDCLSEDEINFIKEKVMKK